MIIKFIKKKFNLIKICAVFTTVCFVVSTLGANLYAIPLAENASQKYEDVFNKASSISAEYGKITSSKDGNSDITVINIQDLHCHPQTQRNISKIISQIADKYNLKKIYVEGGYGDIDTSWLDTIKDEKIKRQIIEGLLEEGILTGSEYYKLTNNNEVELKGIDEEQIHKDNVRRLSWIIENQSRYRDVITKVEDEINILEKMYVNSRNERFNRDIEKYLTNEIDSRRFYRQLAKYVKDINENPDKYNNITAIRLENYPNITKFIALRKTSKDIDVREVTQQLQMVINELKNRLPYNVYTKLLSETENLSDSQKVVELITMLCNKEGINLENKYKSLHTFLESNEINRQLNTVELVQEERQLLSEIRKALSYNNEEYEITFISDFSKYFKDYLEYKLTDADWKYFEKEYEQFRTLYAKYAVVDRIQEIDGDFDEINKYYKINDQRNNIFVANLLKDEEIRVLETDRVRQEEEILKDSKEVIIAVTGGFHSTELEEILAKKEVNTIVITPSIFEGIEKATKQYKGIIKDQSRFFQHQALAYTLASCTTDTYRQKLLYSMAKDILGGNVERLKEVLGENVDLTVFDDLQPLTEQEQEQISDQKNLTAVAASIMVDLLPKQGGMTILRPNMDNIILEISEKLVREGIFLSKGPVLDAERADLPNLKGISPEVYARMHDVIQEALLAWEGLSTKESDESISGEENVREGVSEEEDFTEESVDETSEPESVTKEEKVDSSYLTEERKAELFKRFYNNNREAFYKLINVCCRESVQFDLSKDSALLDMFIRKFNSYYDLEDMELLIVRSVNVAKRFLIDTNLKFASFEKFIDFFDDDVIGENGQPEYINSFSKLFSLKQGNLQFFYDKIDGISAADLVYYYEAEDIDRNLTFLLKRYGQELAKLNDYSRLVNLFDNIDKLDSLSEQEFSNLMSLSDKVFVDILDKSKDSSQLKNKLAVGKKFYFKGYDDDIAKLLFANAEKIQGLSANDFTNLMRLNKEAISFILDNARNASDIKTILSLQKGMGLSSRFDKSENVNDFIDPRFKALVKYISIGDRDFYSKLFDYGTKTVKLIVDSVDAEFVRDYIFNPNYEDIYKKLLVELVNSEIKNLAFENNYLALKLILNKDFNRLLTESRLDNISDRDNIVARYYSAIAVSRIMYDGAKREIKNYSLDDKDFTDLIENATNIYTRMMKTMLNVILIDANTKIYALCNSERLFGKDRFNIDSLREIIEYMGIPIEIPEENIYKRLGTNDNASKMWLQAIENFVMDSDKTKGYFVFRGHGGEESLLVYDPSARQNGLATGHKAERITPEQLAESLFKLATRDQDSVDLRNITIDLSCCNSYFFARNVYKILEQKFEEYSKTHKGFEGTYPTIITAAGLETKTGITDFRRMEGNLHKGINRLLRNFQRGSIPVLSLGMIGVSEYLFRDSNITMFTSFFDKSLLRDLAKVKKEINDYVNSEQSEKEEEPEISKEQEETFEQVVGETEGNLSSVLPLSVTEASVFKGDKTAPLWEELVYRAIPTLVLTMLLIASTMFLPAVPVVAVIAKLTCVGIFSLFQIRFVKAHIVTDWLKAMDAGGPVNLKDVFEDKSLTGREKINKTIEIIKERILVIFPNSKEERSFYRFYTRNKQAISHREGLIIPTIVFSLPYLAAIIFFNSMPVVAIATIISMALHFINNEVARTLEEKEKLKEKKSSVEFLDIQKRLNHVELLIDNPQMKMDLPEIKVGRLASMFGLETLDERRAKNLSDYEKVRDNFINRLNPEILQKQKESIENELSRIEGKKRKTKKDKEKIAELKEKLEIIEKEYPKIRAELLSTDTKKVEKIIDSINSLLPILEEIENILYEIEIFRNVNGDTEETRELEREFLDFTEQTLMRELMSLYDANVTGLHVRRVVAFSKLIGSNMPFGNNVRMMYNLMLSSILHDIGKNLVPGTILNKQGSFDDLERDIMDFHVVFGGFILRSSILKNLSYTAENHHYTTKDSPRSYSFDSKMGYEHEAADYEEAQIAKIVTLTDVYEAVSPKLSFSTERTYQFPRKIRDISDMLENIGAEVDLTEFQKKEVIVLLAEIAQIDSEEDVTKKQEMEQAFIKKVLYNRSRSFVINYIREKNYDNVRANAFKIVFTKSPQEIFEELGKTEEEFMYDFESDPEGTIDRCMSLVSEFEFDTDVVRAFLEFYFSSEDININDEIIESLNKEKESAFIVYMKNLSYSLYKMFRRARFMMVRFAPVIASIFSEEQEGVSVKEKFNIDTVINYTVTIKRRNGDTHFLYFDEKGFQQMGRDSGITMSMGSYGIQEIKYDEDGKIVDIILEPGATIDTDASGGEILVGSEAENLSFEDIEEQIKENYERKHHQKLEQEGFLLKPIMEDTGTTEKVDVYLDDDVKTILATIEDAINNNKLMVIHVFKEGFKTQNLSLWQRYQKYKVVYGLLDSRSKFESTFSKTSEIEEQFLKQIEDGLSEEERDMEWIKRNAAKTFFALREVLKNNFDHGNLGLFEYPIALHISKDNNGRVTEFSTYNLSTKPITLDRAEEKSLSDLMYEAYISGSHKGAEYMTDSFFTNLEYGDDIKISVGEEVYRIYRTKVTLKTEQEQEQALEKYNQYRQQKAEERRRYEQASEAEKRRMEEIQRQKDLEDFWGMQTRDTVSRLYNRGLTKYLRQYLKQTGKLVENLTEEESAAIRQKAENYRFTLPGLAYGALLEIFALWEPNFIDRHNFDSSTRAGMIAVVWTVRALSIGIGLTTAFLSVSALPVSTILLAAAVPAIFGAVTISSSFIIHLLWNIGAVLTTNKGESSAQNLDEVYVKEHCGARTKLGKKLSRSPVEIIRHGRKNILKFNFESIAKLEDSATFETYGITFSYVDAGSGQKIISITLPDGTIKSITVLDGQEKNLIIVGKDRKPHIFHFTFKDISEITAALDGTAVDIKKLKRYGLVYDSTEEVFKFDAVTDVKIYSLKTIGDILDNNITIKTPNATHYIHFDKERPYTTEGTPISDSDLGLYGIEYIERDENGKIINVLLKEDSIITIDARQPVKTLEGDVLTEKDILYRMEEISMSQTMILSDLSTPHLRNRLIRFSVLDKQFIQMLLAAGVFQDEIDKIDVMQDNPLKKVKKETMETIIGIIEEQFKQRLRTTDLDQDQIDKIDFKKDNPLEALDKNKMKKITLEGGLRSPRILDDLPVDQIRQVLLRAGLTKEQVDGIDFTKENPLEGLDDIMNALLDKNPQLDAGQLTIDPRLNGLENLVNNPALLSIAVDALIRTIDALIAENKLPPSFKLDRDSTLEQLIDVIRKINDTDVDFKDFEEQFRGIFGEIYCANTIVVGTFHGIKLRLQLPERVNEEGIDLIDPVTGIKIQVKTGERDIVGEHLAKNWIELNPKYGLKKIPVLTVKEVKNEQQQQRSQEYGGVSYIQGFNATKSMVSNFVLDFSWIICNVSNDKMSSASNITLGNIIKIKDSPETKIEEIDNIMKILGVENFRLYTNTLKDLIKQTLQDDVTDENIENIESSCLQLRDAISSLVYVMAAQNADGMYSEQDLIRILKLFDDSTAFNDRRGNFIRGYDNSKKGTMAAAVKPVIAKTIEIKNLFIEYYGSEGTRYYGIFVDLLKHYIEAENETARNAAWEAIENFLNDLKPSNKLQDLRAGTKLVVNRSRTSVAQTQTTGSAILPENMGLVNRIMQSKFGNAFVAATVIAFKEFKASMKPSFVDMHQSESGRKGAQQLRDFITRFDVVETDGLAARIIKTILGTIVKGASIVKHIAIDYRYIKASGIQEAINMFGNNTYMDENGQIHIPPVLIVDDLTGLKDLNNTGIKVNGKYIYQVGQKGILVYGAEGVNSEDISMAVNESQMIKDAIEQMIREKGYEGVSVEVDGVIQEEGEGVRFENGITIIGTEELQNQSATYIDGYVSSSIELKRSMGVMYSQKALINLESIVNIESLRQALKQGRARKIISKAQYDQLQMTYEEIMAMREAGIEIYVDSNAIDENLKKIGITGQIIRKDNQIFIHDYYTQEDVEVEEVSENNSLTDIENMLVNSQKLILIDIKVLANKFQKENILGAYKGLNNLIGNMKLKTGIGQLTETDIKSLGYNLDYNKLPQLTLTKPLQEYTKAEIEDMLTASILSMDTNTEIRIILKAIDKKDALKDLFTQIMKERILAKTALTQNYKEFGLKDKKMEILLGEMLYKQLDFSLEDKDPNNYDNIDITYIDDDGVRKEVTGKENDLIKKITQDTEKAMREDKVAINSIIEIILTYGDSYKDKQLARQLDVNDARNYRAMMSAA